MAWFGRAQGWALLVAAGRRWSDELYRTCAQRPTDKHTEPALRGRCIPQRSRQRTSVESPCVQRRAAAGRHWRPGEQCWVRLAARGSKADAGEHWCRLVAHRSHRSSPTTFMHLLIARASYCVRAVGAEFVQSPRQPCLLPAYSAPHQCAPGGKQRPAPRSDRHTPPSPRPPETRPSSAARTDPACEPPLRAAVADSLMPWDAPN